MTAKKRTPPFSIRFTDSELERVKNMAQRLDMSTASFIRHKIFDSSATGDFTSVKGSQVKLDKKALAELLAMLGASRIANNLNQIAKSVNMGTLTVSDENIEAQLWESYESIAFIKNKLMEDLGFRGQK